MGTITFCQLQLQLLILMTCAITITAIITRIFTVIAITVQLPSQLQYILWISMLSSWFDLNHLREDFSWLILVKLIHFEMEKLRRKISCTKYAITCVQFTAITITRTLGLINYNYTHIWFVQLQLCKVIVIVPNPVNIPR